MNNDLNSFSSPITFFIIICPFMIFFGYRHIKNIFGIGAAKQDLFPLVIFWASIPVGFGVSFAFFSFFLNLKNADNAYFLFFMFAAVVFMSTWQKRKQNAGSILLNLGRFSNKTTLIAYIVIWLINFLPNGFLKFYEGLDTTLGFIIYLIDWVFSIFLILSVAFSRVDITEKGINYLFTIVKWAAIKEYKWIESQGNVLYIRHQAGLPLMPIITLQIPLAKKNQVEQLMSRYLPTNSNFS